MEKMITYIEKNGDTTVVNLQVETEAYKLFTNDAWRLPKLREMDSHKLVGDRKVPGVSPYESFGCIQLECQRQLVAALVGEISEANMKLPEGDRSDNPVIGTRTVKRGIRMGMWKLLATLQVTSPTLTVKDLDYLNGCDLLTIKILSAEVMQKKVENHRPVIKGRVLDGTSSRVHNANDRQKLEPFQPKKDDRGPNQRNSAPAKTSN